LSLGIFEQVRSIAADLFAVEEKKITTESSPTNLETWDSTQHLMLVLAVEENFGFQLIPEEIERMHNLGDVVSIVEAKLAAKKG
jgi:acyl carrier protein